LLEQLHMPASPWTIFQSMLTLKFTTDR
jgi:hypothetical protein